MVIYEFLAIEMIVRYVPVVMETVRTKF